MARFSKPRRANLGLVSVWGMPAGLDGNPNPMVTEARTEVLATVADSILRIDGERLLIGVDGQSGSGKSTFGDELAAVIQSRGVSVVRSTTDSFHRPRAQRVALGPTSAEGFYADSHQLDLIVDELLRPFSEGADRVLVAAFDEPSDASLRAVVEIADAEPTVLVFDGLFLQRPELEQWWDHAVYLDADERSDREWLDFLLSNLPEASTARANVIDERLERARWPRYRSGWRHYVEQADPASKASMVIDNNDLARPRIIRRAATSS